MGRGGVTSLISPLLGGVRRVGVTTGLSATVTAGLTLVAIEATLQGAAGKLTWECDAVEGVKVATVGEIRVKEVDVTESGEGILVLLVVGMLTGCLATEPATVVVTDIVSGDI